MPVVLVDGDTLSYRATIPNGDLPVAASPVRDTVVTGPLHSRELFATAFDEVSVR